MALRNTDRSWGAPAKLLHWVIALLIFAQFALGWLAVTWRLSPTKLQLYIWHKSFGILILTLVAVRIFWRLLNPVPRLPLQTSPAEQLAARASHALLYGLMLAIPFSGWVINSASGVPFRVFWWFPLPAITPVDKGVEAVAQQIHFALFVVLAALLVAHIAAALRHHYIKRNDVLTRMLPGKGTRS